MIFIFIFRLIVACSLGYFNCFKFIFFMKNIISFSYYISLSSIKVLIELTIFINHKILKKMGEQASKYVKLKWSWEKRGKEMEEYLKKKNGI